MSGVFLSFGDEAVVIDGTVGNDTLIAGVSEQAINLLGGDDVATVAGGSGYLVMGQGNDSVVFGAQVPDNTGWIVDTGEGADYVHVLDTVSKGSISVRAGAGNDTIKLGTALTQVRTVDAGGGINSIDVADSGFFSTASPWEYYYNGSLTQLVWSFNPALNIFTGSDDDTVTAGAGDIYYHSVGGKDTVVLGDGKHKINFRDGEINLKMGDGEYFVDAKNATSSGTNLFNIGNDDGLIYLPAGKNYVDIGVGNASVWAIDFDGTPGFADDVVVVQGNAHQMFSGDAYSRVDIRVGAGENSVTVVDPSQLYIENGSDSSADQFVFGDLWGQNHLALERVRTVDFSNPVSVEIKDLLPIETVIPNVPGTSTQNASKLSLASLALITGTGPDKISVGDNLYTFPSNYVDLYPDAFKYKTLAHIYSAWGSDTISVGDGSWAIFTSGSDNGTGADNDLVSVGTGKYRTVLLGAGADTLSMGDELLGKYCVDLSGTSDDVLSPSFDSIKIGNGDGVISAVNGNSKISYGMGAVTISGGNGELWVDSPSALNVSWKTGKLVALGQNGDDIVYAFDGNHEIYLGEGNNTTHVNGAGIMNFAGGNGNDIVSGKIDGIASFQLQGGKNTIEAGVGAQYVSVGSGDDYFSSRGNIDGDVDMGDGNNTVRYNGPSNSLTKTGIGNDEVIIDSIQGSIAILSGDGADSVRVDQDGGYLFANIGGGDNIVTYEHQSTGVNIQGGSGNNAIHVGESISIGIIVADGNNSITIGSGELYLELGSGNNTIAVGKATGNSYIQTGDGNDRVTLNDGKAIVVVGAGSNVITLNGGEFSVSTGNGSDRGSITAGNHSVSLGDGANALTMTGGSAVINTGSGNDNFDLKDSTAVVASGAGGDVFYLTTSNAVIDAGNGADSFFVSGGDVTITGAAGADSFSYTYSAGTVPGGSTVIADYEVGVDTVQVHSNGVVPTPTIGANSVTYDFGGTEILTIIGTNDPNLIALTWQ